MKETYYFTHDYNARNDHKIKKLIANHGFQGYGLFWAIIEDLYNNDNRLHFDCETIAFDLRTTKEVVCSIINDFGLFIVDGEFFGSISVEKRINARNSKSTKARESANYRWSKCESDANASIDDCDTIAIKENESKVKEKKEKIEFDVFWNLYSKKVGSKDNCTKKWNKLDFETQKTIIEFIPKFLKTIKDKQFQPFPETFLNQNRWNNEIDDYSIKSQGESRIQTIAL
jgi:hypothetical protein